jgi:hypothetical protein
MHILSRFPVVKKAENRLIESYIHLLTKRRKKGWQERALPGLIIIGGMKCGTSSLFNYLNQHPQLFGSKYKEVSYFCRDAFYSQGEQWYRAHFPRIEDMPDGSVAFDATPDYLLYPEAPRRISRLLPDVKLIALFRNPTERAISHYFHNIKKGREKEEILDAMKFEHAVYKRRSMYKEQIERYYKLFASDQIMIIQSEEFFKNPTKTLRDIYLFLGVDHHVEISDLSPRQIGFNREAVRGEVYEYLNDYFEPFNQELFEYIGKEFQWHCK